jgi:hypothetical protein
MLLLVIWGQFITFGQQEILMLYIITRTSPVYRTTNIANCNKDNIRLFDASVY